MTYPPGAAYLFINKPTNIECQNISEGNITDEVINSVWFRILPNKTQPHKFDNSISKRVRVHYDTLHFSSGLSSDEGEYYCCAPAGWPCSDRKSVYMSGEQVLCYINLQYCEMAAYSALGVLDYNVHDIVAISHDRPLQAN